MALRVQAETYRLEAIDWFSNRGLNGMKRGPPPGRGLPAATGGAFHIVSDAEGEELSTNQPSLIHGCEVYNKRTTNKTYHL